MSRVGLEQRRSDTGVFYVVTVALDDQPPLAMTCEDALDFAEELRRAADLAEKGTRENRGRPI